MKKGDKIKFKYKGSRLVKGEIIHVTPTGYNIELSTDYFGKNETWYKGERKTFNRKEMKIKNP